MPPLGVGDFNFSDMELVMKSPLKMALPAGFVVFVSGFFYFLRDAGEKVNFQGTSDLTGLKVGRWDAVRFDIEAKGEVDANCHLNYWGDFERCCITSSLGEKFYA